MSAAGSATQNLAVKGDCPADTRTDRQHHDMLPTFGGARLHLGDKGHVAIGIEQNVPAGFNFQFFNEIKAGQIEEAA